MRVSIKHSISLLFVILSLNINAQEIISPNGKIKVKKGDTLKIECLPKGGFVGIIK